jgi:hypothetical protein
MKLIALLTAIFVVSANLDNVPDVPAVMTSISASSTVHYSPLDGVQAIHTAWDLLPKTENVVEYVLDELHVASPPCKPRSVHQAADSSPPTA